MTDDDIRMFRTQMKLLQRRLRGESAPVQGLSRSTLQVLGAVARLADGAAPSQVGELLQMTTSNVAAALRELEAAGLIRREKDPGDARRARLSVTEPGAGVVAEFRRERDTWLGQAVETLLSEEEQQVLIAAGRLLERLSDYQQPAPASRRGPVAGER